MLVKDAVYIGCIALLRDVTRRYGPEFSAADVAEISGEREKARALIRSLVDYNMIKISHVDLGRGTDQEITWAAIKYQLTETGGKETCHKRAWREGVSMPGKILTYKIRFPIVH